MAKRSEATEVIKFTKEQIISAKKYKNNLDLVNALLQDDKEYSFEEVDALIEKYLKGKVN